MGRLLNDANSEGLVGRSGRRFYKQGFPFFTQIWFTPIDTGRAQTLFECVDAAASGNRLQITYNGENRITYLLRNGGTTVVMQSGTTTTALVPTSVQAWSNASNDHAVRINTDTPGTSSSSVTLPTWNHCAVGFLDSFDLDFLHGVVHEIALFGKVPPAEIRNLMAITHSAEWFRHSYDGGHYWRFDGRGAVRDLWGDNHLIGRTGDSAKAGVPAAGKLNLIRPSSRFLRAAPAGGDLVRVRSETAEISESPVFSRAAVRLQAETGQISETLPRTLGMSRVFSETEELGEVLVWALAAARVRDEVAQIAESLASALGKTQVENETEQITTASASALGKTQVRGESEEIAEAQATAKGIVQERQDTEQIAESRASVSMLTRPLLETLALSELGLPVRALLRHENETAAVAELGLPVSVLLRVRNDAVSLAEVLVVKLSQGSEVLPIELPAYIFGPADLSARIVGNIEKLGKVFGSLDLPPRK
ncbi:MAG: hypothetical protein QNJ62_06500 [Methyloceanibacter sp.]|nr:hypothetical protein [Methyloceanibacter sp.]